MNLLLHEQLLLLALDDEKGTIHWEAGQIPQIVAGALLAELRLHERIEFRRTKKSYVVAVSSTAPMGDSLLDEVLAVVSHAPEPLSVIDWVRKFSAISELKERIAEGLCDKGILEEKESRTLFFFKRTDYPTRDLAPETAFIAELREAIFQGGAVDERMALLISLSHQSGLLAIPFSRAELKQAKKRLINFHESQGL